MPADDAKRPLESVLLEGGEFHGLGRRPFVVQHVAEELQQRPEAHGAGIEQIDVGKEEVV